MEYVDITPKWEDLVVPMFMVISNDRASVDSKMDLLVELKRMARAADKWNEYCKGQK